MHGHVSQIGEAAHSNTHCMSASYDLVTGDVLTLGSILYHADAEWMNIDGDAMLTQVPAKILYDNHIDFDILPADCFTDDSGSRIHHAEIADGGFKVGTQSYQCLVVPGAKQLPGKLTTALRNLEKAGVPVIYMTEETDLLCELRFIKRDIIVDGCPKLRCCHCVSGTSDVYMFVNESASDTVSTYVALRGMEDREDCVMLDLLNDSTGTVRAENGRVFLSLVPNQSVIVVFDRENKADLSAKKTLTPAGETDLTFRIETAPYTDMANYTVYAENVGAGELPNITDIRRMPDFSGRIRYTSTFNRPEGIAGIDLGTVGQTAHLWCNGKDLGVRVCPPYRYDLADALDEGENTLVIEVSNTLANVIRDRFSDYLPIPASGLTGGIQWLK